MIALNVESKLTRGRAAARKEKNGKGAEREMNQRGPGRGRWRWRGTRTKTQFPEHIKQCNLKYQSRTYEVSEEQEIRRNIIKIIFSLCEGPLLSISNCFSALIGHRGICEGNFDNIIYPSVRSGSSSSLRATGRYFFIL